MRTAMSGRSPSGRQVTRDVYLLRGQKPDIYHDIDPEIIRGDTRTIVCITAAQEI